MITANFQIKGSRDLPVFIDYTYSEDSPAQSLTIFVHGFKGFKDWGAYNHVARCFAENELPFLKFNFSHNGISNDRGDFFDDLESFQKNTFTKELYDLDEVISFAMSGKAFKAPQKLNLIGTSRGGGIGIIQTCRDKRVNKLATWSALSNFRNLWDLEKEEEWKQKGLIYVHNSRTHQMLPLGVQLLNDIEQRSEKLNILNSARQMSQPWLIIHGDEDTTVPVQQAEELHRQQPNSRLLIIPNANHTLGSMHPWLQDGLPKPLLRACEETIRFFKEEV